MQLRPDLIPNLQHLLAELENCRATRRGMDPDIASAEAAVSRLQGRIAELDGQAAEAANVHIPPDQDRVARLLAGGDVAQLDKKEVETRAAKARQIDVQRRQAGTDLAAVQEHLAQLRAGAAAADQAVALAHSHFLHALGDAIVDAYQRAAREFVNTFIPPLYSIRHRIWSATGQYPASVGRIMPGPTIQWAETEVIRQTGNPDRFRMTRLWPRFNDTLESGEHAVSDELIDKLIEAVRAFPDGAATAPAGADAPAQA